MLYLVTVALCLAQAFGATQKNKYDTHNTECARVRKAWHLMDESERSLYMKGMLALRDTAITAYTPDNTAKTNMFDNVAYGHLADGLNDIHNSGINVFYHSYLLWELESSIRDLGGEYECFGMPYYDMTVDHGKESTASILDGVGGLGSNGDPDDYGVVTDIGFSDDDYWYSHEDATASIDEENKVSIKRHQVDSSYDGTILDSAETVANDLFGSSSDSKSFRQISIALEMANPLKFLTGGHFQGGLASDTLGGANQPYDPIWWLFHSWLQLQLSSWIEVHGHLDDVSGTFQNYGVVTTDYNEAITFYGMQDENFKCNNYDITVDMLWDHSEWNVMYDVGTFWDNSGLNDGQYSYDDFLDKDRWTNEQSQQSSTKHSAASFWYYLGVSSLSVVILALFYFAYARFARGKEQKYTAVPTESEYGSVAAVL